MTPNPRTPSSISPYARACLEAVAAAGYGPLVSLGGALALGYYHEYRSTADTGAWWAEGAGREDKRRVLDTITTVLAGFGQTRLRAWAEVASVELLLDARVAFSFQIADRSARLEPSLPAPWPQGVYIDHFDDLLASKMDALVNRGAPRDFRDVHELCIRGLTSPAALWRLWGRRRQGAGEPADEGRASLAVHSHLERIERVRPLASITDSGDRESSGALRAWVREELLRGLV